MKKYLHFIAIFLCFVSCVSYTDSKWKSTTGNVVLSLDSDEWSLYIGGVERYQGTFSISKNKIELTVTAMFSSGMWCQLSPGTKTWDGKFTEKDRLEFDGDNGTYVLYRD